jgi:hypothetical protein
MRLHYQMATRWLLVILYGRLRPQLQLLAVESYLWVYHLRPHLEVVPKLVTAGALHVQLVVRLQGCGVESLRKKLSQPESDDAHLPALVARAPASHMWTLKDERMQRKSRNSRSSPQLRKSSGIHVPRHLCSGCKQSQCISRSARLRRTSI